MGRVWGGGSERGGGGHRGRGVRVDVNREVKFLSKFKKKLRGGRGRVGSGGGPIRGWGGGGGVARFGVGG